MSYADGGPTRTAVLRGQRSYADSGPVRTAVLRGRRSCADGGPVRTAVLRGRRSCADGSPARTAPEGLVPLDSHSSPAGGTGDYNVTAAIKSAMLLIVYINSNRAAALIGQCSSPVFFI